MKISNRTNANDPALFLNSPPLIQSRTYKYLGIHIDNTLKFHTQVEHIQSKLYQLSHITFSLKKTFESHHGQECLFFVHVATPPSHTAWLVWECVHGLKKNGRETKPL